MQRETILVLGATGTTGSEVARQLITAGHRPRLWARDAARASAFAGAADIVEGDLSDDADLGRGLAGVNRLYLVSSGLEGPTLEKRVIDAARKAGVHRVVKLSVMTADRPRISYAKWHGGTEKYLMDSGLAWTMLRPGNFMTNAFDMWTPTIKTRSAFYQASGEGKWAAVDPADIGAVAVAALTLPGHEGRAYTLTGPESLNAAGYAAKIGHALAKHVEFVDVSPEDSQRELLGLGLPGAYVDAALELLAAMRANEWDIVSQDIATVLGREPAGFDEWARRNAARLG
ncbi:SDR family oxidoreductase [Streptomyces mirabilis]